MIGGVHTIFHSKQAEALRAFFRDVLEFPSVDAGHGWLLFAAPPGELAVHPARERSYPELYLMCADIKAEVARLRAKGVEFLEPVSEQDWGSLARLQLPDGESLGLYQPKHPLAIRMASSDRPTTRGKGKPSKRGASRSRSRRRP